MKVPENLYFPNNKILYSIQHSQFTLSSELTDTYGRGRAQRNKQCYSPKDQQKNYASNSTSTNGTAAVRAVTL